MCFQARTAPITRSTKALTLPPRTLIRDLQPNQLIEGIFAMQNCQLGQTKTGKPYLKCLLADRSGRTPGRMWNTTEELFNRLPTDGFVFVEGQTQPYQGEMQIVIQQIGAAQPSDKDLEDLLPSTRFDVKQMFDELNKRLDGIEHPAVAMLAQKYLEDEDLMARFRRAPAAMTLHHAYLGGLLEHTLNLMNLARLVCPLYEKLNTEIVLVGSFLHDLGKCAELNWQTGFSYSEDGNLVGHVALGVIWLDAKAGQCAAAGTPIPPALLRVLHHIILSHHGDPQFGALKVPATPEAIAVSLLDNLDAKLHMALAATRWGAQKEAQNTELGGNFTEKIWALDARLYRPDPTIQVLEESNEAVQAPRDQSVEGGESQLWSKGS